MGWFYGFKLHLALNHRGELLNAIVTTGEVHDIKPVPKLLQGLFGKVFGDKGYLSEPLRNHLTERGIDLITRVRKAAATPLRLNMKEPLLSTVDSFLLGKRALIETAIDQMKSISQVEHTRHRASTGFLWNLLAALIAYCHQPKKPSLSLQVTLPKASA